MVLRLNSFLSMVFTYSPRQYNGKTVLTILNGKKADNQVDVARYAEVIGSHTTATDVLTGATVDLTKNIPLTQRQAMVLSF